MISRRSLLLIALIICLAISSYGYVFDCMDECLCDTDDEVIHCHNRQDRTTVQLPKRRLRGFSVLGLTRNNISALPSEELLLEILPDLQAVDVELNPHFECSTIEHYQKIRVLSSCDKNPNEIAELANYTTIVEDAEKPTKDCDISCQTERHYEKLHAYLERLWEMIKEKFGELTRKHKFLQDVKDFFSEVGGRVSQFANQVKDEIGSSRRRGDAEGVDNVTMESHN